MNSDVHKGLFQPKQFHVFITGDTLFCVRGSLCGFSVDFVLWVFWLFFLGWCFWFIFLPTPFLVITEMVDCCFMALIDFFIHFSDVHQNARGALQTTKGNRQ